MPNSNTPESAYKNLCDHVRQANILGSVVQLLEWDEQTKMPGQGAAHRADQAAALTQIVHQRITDPRIAEWLDAVENSPLVEDPRSGEGANARKIRRAYDRQTKLPARLVEEMTRQSVLGQHAWVESRKNDDFPSFAPHLEKTFELKREEADAIGYEDSPYDALLDAYEPEMLTSEAAAVLAYLREGLVPLVEQAANSQSPPDASLLHRVYPADRQESFARAMARRIGFDFDRGRLDVTAHPFCCSPGPSDVRITTRYNEHFFNEAFFGVLHEAGHGIYEQGLPTEEYGLPTGEAVSLGVHESQSRLWENFVGRSQAFCRFAFPRALAVFPESLADVTPDEFYRAINRVEPSFIRVEADEATYNLHILIRFEMELGLLSGDIPINDAPAAWNEKYQAYLGITPPDDRLGILQDVHWSAGLVGYFPTYALGNLMAAQLFAKANKDLGDLDEQFAAGSFSLLRDWLRKNVHQEGQRYNGSELIEKVTGKKLSRDPLIDYLGRKVGGVYQL
jgi:carboxypeptidase Taq